MVTPERLTRCSGPDRESGNDEYEHDDQGSVDNPVGNATEGGA